MISRISKTAIAIAMMIALPLVAHADTWQIDPAHTSVEFTVRHMMISNVRGQFQKTAGTITTNGGGAASATIDATIDASSVDTRVERRDAHLKSPDFLDVAKYPTITFKSSKVEGAGPGKFTVTGDLTLHGVTKSITVTLVKTGEGKGMQGETRIGYNCTFKIKRSDFGMKTYVGPIGDEVTLMVNIEAIKQ